MYYQRRNQSRDIHYPHALFVYFFYFPSFSLVSIARFSFTLARRDYNAVHKSCYSSLMIIISGQERFGNMTRVYYKEAVGCILVFDVTRPASFEAASKWKADLDSKVLLPSGSKIPCVLLGNKVSIKLLQDCFSTFWYLSKALNLGSKFMSH